MMNSRIGGSKSKASTALWGTASSKCAVDVSLLNSLSNIALSFEGCAVPTVESLKSLSEHFQSQIESEEYVNTNIDEKDDTYDTGNQANKHFDSSSKTSQNNRNKRNRRKAQDNSITNSNSQSPNSTNILSFFNILKRHYGDSFAAVYESFADSLQVCQWYNILTNMT
jgi:hypothetical protein